MAVIAALLALCFACIFFGAAIYINVAEHPARMRLRDGAALRQWASSDDRALVLQGILALLSAGMGFAAAWLLNDWRWCVGAALMLSIWPYTLVLVLPLNRRLRGMLAAQQSSPRALLERWGRLHAIRSLLSLLGILAYWGPVAI